MGEKEREKFSEKSKIYLYNKHEFRKYKWLY